LTEQSEHYLRLLQRASSALDQACKLLDKRFGSRKWRDEWTIGETADEIRLEAWGWPSPEEGQEEAEKRKAADGKDWGCWADATGSWLVQLAD
jgi:hypothetical protein